MKTLGIVSVAAAATAAMVTLGLMVAVGAATASPALAPDDGPKTIAALPQDTTPMFMPLMLSGEGQRLPAGRRRISPAAGVLVALGLIGKAGISAIGPRQIEVNQRVCLERTIRQVHRRADRV